MKDKKQWAETLPHRKANSQKFISGITPVDNWKANTEISSRRIEITMKYKERPLRALLQGFAEETTAHGISQIASSKSVFWRLFWVLVTLGGGGMVIYQGILLFNTYMSKPIKSDIDITYRRSIKFPAVTICNLNIIRKSFLRKFSRADTNTSRMTRDLFDEEKINTLKRFLNTDSSNAEEILNLENVTIDPEEYTKQQLLINLASYNESELERGGHRFRELVFRCYFKGFSCKDRDFLKYWKTTWNWRYGNCFTFNSGATSQGKRKPVLTITKPGPQYGLTLDLFVNQKEYIPILSQEAGVRVLITGQRSIPFPVDEGFTVSPGFATSIALRQLSITRVDPFNNGSCYSAESVEEFSIYKRYKGSSYSVQGCMYSCLARAQVDNCNCTEMKFPSGKGICSTTSEVRCIQEMQRRYDDDDGLGCSAKCPQPCSQVTYRMSSSSSAWSRGYEARPFFLQS